MRNLIFAFTSLLLVGCGDKHSAKADLESIKKEIYKAEDDFKNLAQTKGIPDAFYEFAADDAVINENDTLIQGKENIKSYYSDQKYKLAKVTWKPDFVDVSEDGTMAYTYGKYVWKSKDFQGKEVEFTGVFHTVWKKQQNGSWKYVWD